MLVSDFNYDLPEERIAKFPPEKRGTTRLLVLISRCSASRPWGKRKTSYACTPHRNSQPSGHPPRE